MKKIKLNENLGRKTSIDEYILDPTEKYVIDIEEEMEFQVATMMSFQIMGPPPALKNYHAWLFENGFNVDEPNPTNEVVACYYGVKPLWKTAYSQGVVVKVICTPFTGHPVKGVFLCVTVTNSNERQSNYTGKGNGLNHQQTSQT